MRKNRRTLHKDFRILTLDDDVIMTSTLQAYFQRSGYYVDVINDPYLSPSNGCGREIMTYCFWIF